MTKIAKRLSALALLVGAAVAAPAQAAFTAPAAQSFSTLLGSATAGSESGVWELQGVITAAGVAIVLLTITMVGIVFARKVVRKFTG